MSSDLGYFANGEYDGEPSFKKLITKLFSRVGVVPYEEFEWDDLKTVLEEIPYEELLSLHTELVIDLLAKKQDVEKNCTRSGSFVAYPLPKDSKNVDYLTLNQANQNTGLYYFEVMPFPSTIKAIVDLLMIEKKVELNIGDRHTLSTKIISLYDYIFLIDIKEFLIKLIIEPEDATYISILPVNVGILLKSVLDTSVNEFFSIKRSSNRFARWHTVGGNSCYYEIRSAKVQVNYFEIFERIALCTHKIRDIFNIFYNNGLPSLRSQDVLNLNHMARVEALMIFFKYYYFVFSKEHSKKNRKN